MLVLTATEGVMVALTSVHASQDWKDQIQDTVADNAPRRLVLERPAGDIADLDLALAGMVLEKNGEIVVTARRSHIAHQSPARVGEPACSLGIALKGWRHNVPVRHGAPWSRWRGDNLRTTIGGIGALLGALRLTRPVPVPNPTGTSTKS